MAVADSPFTEEQRAWLEKMIPPQPTTQTMGRAATLGDPPIPPRPSSTPLGECWTRIGRCIYASAGDLSKVTSARHLQRRRTAPRPLTLRPRSMVRHAQRRRTAPRPLTLRIYPLRQHGRPTSATRSGGARRHDRSSSEVTRGNAANRAPLPVANTARPRRNGDLHPTVRPWALAQY